MNPLHRFHRVPLLLAQDDDGRFAGRGGIGERDTGKRRRAYRERSKGSHFPIQESEEHVEKGRCPRTSIPRAAVKHLLKYRLKLSSVTNITAGEFATNLAATMCCTDLVVRLGAMSHTGQLGSSMKVTGGFGRVG